MSEGNGKPLDPAELASLPVDDPRRRAFVQQLAGLSAEQRVRWNEEFAFSDRLREQLAEAEVPAGLEGRLMAIAQQEPSANVGRSGWRFLGIPMNARMAAAFVIVAGLLTYYLTVVHNSTPSASLDASVSKKIVSLAVAHDAAPLTIASSDPDAVKKSLEGAGLDVPVVMLTPAAGSTLTGGGSCDFGGTKAVFTQWKNGDSSYTLYEFNGKKLGAPALFYATILQPTELWHDAFHYKVAVFPGAEGKCCWALVMNTDSAKNIFSQYTGGY